MKNKKTWFALALTLLVAIHFVFLLNLKFTAWPEMLLWPYLWLRGLLPYHDFAVVHTPVLIAKLVVFYKLFGVGVLQLRIFTWCLIVITDLLLYWIAGKLWNKKAAVLSVAIYVFLQLFYDGNGLWFDLMLAPLALITFYLLKKKNYFWTGVFWALMFFTKQTAIWFVIPIVFEISQNAKNKTQSSLGLIFGSSAMFIIFLSVLLIFRVLPAFYDWAINFGLFVLPSAQGQIQLPDLKNLVAALAPFAVFAPLIANKKNKSLNLMLWSVSGVAGAYPRFEFFHFQPGLPFLAIAAGIIFSNRGNKNFLAKLFMAIYVTGFSILFSGFFIRNYGEGVRFYENDVRDLVSYIKDNTKPGDKIFVMNWWDNIYALTDTLPATDPWVPQLAWYQEIPAIQNEEVSDLANSKPMLILLQNYSSVGLSAYKPQKVYDYVIANYKLKETIDGIKILVPKR